LYFIQGTNPENCCVVIQGTSSDRFIETRVKNIVVIYYLNLWPIILMEPWLVTDSYLTALMEYSSVS